MATIKSFTDLEQSKKLAEILPTESADMHYMDDHYDPLTLHLGFCNDLYEEYKSDKWDYIPCWSLASLLGVLPKGTNISTPKPINELGYCCWNKYDEIYANNPIDACVSMIENLHELKML